MRSTYRLHVLPFLLLYLAAGCTPAALPVNGNTLYHDAYPKIAVSANAPLQLRSAGKEWSSLESDTLMAQPLASFTYALYATTAEGLVTAHAHTMIVQPTNAERWIFLLEGHKLFNSLHYSEISRGGHGWTVQLMCIPSENDWVSGTWQANNRSVPELWLAKRFSGTPYKSTRVVAEYREAWPSCLNPEARDLFGTTAECLAGFHQRADAAFSLNETPLPEAPGNAPHLPGKSLISPDLAALAGRVERDDHSSDKDKDN